MASFNWPGSGGSGVPFYANLAAFPAASSSVGTLAGALDTGIIYESFGGNWIVVAGPADVLSVGTIDSQTPSANGAVDHANQLIMQSASVSVPGLVNLTTQSFAGNKTFTGTISASNLSGTNTGDVTIAAFGSTPNANGLSLSAQVLNMQPADGSNPGGVSTAAQTFAGSKTFGSVALFADGAVGGPGISFSGEATSGWYRVGTGDVALAVSGVNAFEAKTFGTQTSFAFGTGAAASLALGAPVTFNSSQNAIQYFTYGNVNTGTNSATVFNIVNGTAGGVTASIENYGYTTAGYLSGGGLIGVGSNMTQLNVVCEFAGSIRWNVGGRTLATEAMRLGATGTGLTLNKGWGSLTLSGGTSGALTINAGATGTYSLNMPTAQGGVSTSLSNDGSGNLTWAAILTNPMTTLGDLIYGGASGVVTRLAGDVSNTRKFLRELSVASAATAPVWDTLVSGDIPNNGANTSGSAASLSATLIVAQGGTGLATLAAHDVMVGNGTGNVTMISPSTAGKVMVSNGTSADPSFAAFNSTNVTMQAPTTTQISTSATGTNGYVFVVTSANATVGATYTNNGHTFTVLGTIAGQTLLFVSGASAPTASGTLTKSGGTGDSTITFSSNVSAGTYSPPAGCLYIKIRAVGGGAGGDGTGTGPGTGAAGGSTYFGANLLAANGGTDTVGGTATGGNVFNFNGNAGGGRIAQINSYGGVGAGSVFGGGGAPGTNGLAAGGNAFANSGSGGGGGGIGSTLGTTGSGNGGCAGGYVEHLIVSPAASYPIVIGAGGAGGTTGSTGAAGGNGAAGLILIEEHYQ